MTTASAPDIAATWVPPSAAAPSIPSSQEAKNVDLTADANTEAKEMHRTAFDLSTIAPVLTAGFRALLVEATKRGVLDPPHGRMPIPDPKKIIDNDPRLEESAEYGGGVVDDEMNHAPSGADLDLPKCNALVDTKDVGYDDKSAEDDDDEKLLEYKYDYGFNPLVFLGEYLRRQSPTTILARKNQHDADLAYLRRRAIKGLDRETILRELGEVVVHRRAGIVHGPIVGDLSDRGGILWARAYRSGYDGYNSTCAVRGVGGARRGEVVLAYTYHVVCNGELQSYSESTRLLYGSCVPDAAAMYRSTALLFASHIFIDIRHRCIQSYISVSCPNAKITLNLHISESIIV